MTMRTARFDVFQGKDGQWYWALKSANNRTIAQGEGYTREADAYRAVKAVKKTVNSLSWGNVNISTRVDVKTVEQIRKAFERDFPKTILRNS